jgi:hypothetical protein
LEDNLNENVGSAGRGRHNRSFVILAALTTAAAALHFADHVARGYLVAKNGLDPQWDHSGWPFENRLSPFTFSLFGVALVLIGGIALTLKARAGTAYWIVASLALLALVVDVHFLPTEHQESPHVIYSSWVGAPVIGAIAVANTFLIVALLVAMVVNAIRVGTLQRRTRGRASAAD